MRASRATTLVAGLLIFAVQARAAEHPALAQARALYNTADYDGAIAAATIARSDPASADAAALVTGRARLERHRLRADPSDLAAARDALAAARAPSLSPRDQLDLLVGLGQSLYLGDTYGPAAEIFDTALGRGSLLMHRDRLLLLDWWATALDREAQQRPAEDRPSVYRRIAARMEEELRLDPGSAPSNYWLAAAARGAGDLDRGWDAAIAGWVRAQLSPETSAKLRADLDTLVNQALIPERARTRPQRELPDASTALRTEWELVKEHWK